MTRSLNDITDPRKANYVGAPDMFAIDQAIQPVLMSFPSYGCFLVGSAIARPDFRDIDLRLIMDDADFKSVFPDAGDNWEHDPRWLLVVTSIAEHLRKITRLPIDFQIQPITLANKRYPTGERHSIGVRLPTSVSSGGSDSG